MSIIIVGVSVSFSRLWLEGKPKGLTDERFTLLLGDSNSSLRTIDDASSGKNKE